MNKEGYLLGLDIGSSSVKASLVSIETGRSIASSQSPSAEMPMVAPRAGWAEQDPGMWWEHVIQCTRHCLQKSAVNPEFVRAIGIAYQMHGLVMVDRNHKVLRSSIIWCDSRAVPIGTTAFKKLGESYCLTHLLNSPGNFTASKLKWVKENEPHIYEHIYKIMLPGDYIAMNLTGEIRTTTTGLSEGVFWDFKEKRVSNELLDYFGFDKSMLADTVPVFSIQGELTKQAAGELGLHPGVKVSYRAGDQPNNAFSLNVLKPGESAATAGTSGVIYSVTDQDAFDERSRVNTFMHVTNDPDTRNGVLLCINGTGILNSWLRKNINSGHTPYVYEQMNAIAAQAPAGSEGLLVLPFGNGSERILENKEIGSSFHGLDFNRHRQPHIFRAAQEGIVFSLKYGFDILEKMGASTGVIRAGKANMFLSTVFCDAFVNSIGARLELYDTDGSKGAALGAGVGAGIYATFDDAFKGLELIQSLEPDQKGIDACAEAYVNWKDCLRRYLQ